MVECGRSWAEGLQEGKGKAWSGQKVHQSIIFHSVVIWIKLLILFWPFNNYISPQIEKTHHNSLSLVLVDDNVETPEETEEREEEERRMEEIREARVREERWYQSLWTKDTIHHLNSYSINLQTARRKATSDKWPDWKAWRRPWRGEGSGWGEQIWCTEVDTGHKCSADFERAQSEAAAGWHWSMGKVKQSRLFMLDCWYFRLPKGRGVVKEKCKLPRSLLPSLVGEGGCQVEQSCCWCL